MTANDAHELAHSLRTLTLTLRIEALEAELHVYQQTCAQLPTILQLLGMGTEQQRERALALFSVIIDALETFWRDTDTDPRSTNDERNET